MSRAFSAPTVSWGALSAQRPGVAAVPILDVDAFRSWALLHYPRRRGGKGCAPSTVKQHITQILHMERTGMNWSHFLSSPAEAAQLGDDWLARLKLDPDAAPTAQAHYTKTLNWVILYAARERGGDPAFRGMTKWGLPPPHRTQPRRHDDDQVARMLQYRHGDPYIERRRRALLWFIVHTGLRRGEVGDIRLQDLDQAQGVLYVGKPRKNGKRREIALPDEAWSSRAPLQAWLAVRIPLPDGSDWLWTTEYHGPPRRMDGNSLYNDDLTDISEELGFRISFTRARHWRGKSLRKAHVPLEVIQEAYGHSSPLTTRGYVDDVDAQDMAHAYAVAGIPGFAARAKTRRKWATGDQQKAATPSEAS